MPRDGGRNPSVHVRVSVLTFVCEPCGRRERHDGRLCRGRAVTSNVHAIPPEKVRRDRAWNAVLRQRFAAAESLALVV